MPMNPSFRQLFVDFVAARRHVRAAAFDAHQHAHPSCAEAPPFGDASTNRWHALHKSLQRLLQWPGASTHADFLTKALLDPYFPAEMIQRTLFSHVTGMRFYIDKNRPELQPLLLRDLAQFAEAFLQIRQDLSQLTSLSPAGIPLDGRSFPKPSGQWCRLCGTCCEIGGVPAVAPPGVVYPLHWRALLEGTRLDNQQLCPFLFQSPGSMHHFCSIHRIKPVPCSAFDAEDCRARQRDGPLHQPPP
ncbi:YkgJ family cysteine cluster protein [Desulfosoma caldarium]|nr:YkgJ family cysteine cluster protein [Desulfosoma caldarium]